MNSPATDQALSAVPPPDTTAPQLLKNGSRLPAFTAGSRDVALPAVGLFAQPVLVDIDADGDFDAFIGNGNGSIVFVRNTGSSVSPAFAPSGPGLASTPGHIIASPALIDIDGDGDLDLFAGTNIGRICRFLNTGTVSSPSFSAASQVYVGMAVVGNAAPAFIDIDADGDPDAFIGAKDGRIRFFRNKGTARDAVFVSEPTNDLEIASPYAHVYVRPVFADIDADGDSDLLVGASDGRLILYRNLGTASVAAFASSTSGFGLSVPSGRPSPAMVDIDADGDLDMFLGAANGATICYTNNGAGLGTANPDGLYSKGSEITILVAFTEEVFVDTSAGLPTLRLNIGLTGRLATYAGGSGTAVLSFRYTVQAEDLAEDLDVAASDALQLHGATISDAAGNAADLSLPAPGSAGSLAANASLLIAGQPPTLLRNGSRRPVYSAPPVALPQLAVASFAAPTFVDIDSDADLDAFVGNGAGDTLLFLNTGSISSASFAGFSQLPGLGDVGERACPVFVDIDADADLDALIGTADGRVLLFRNSGSNSAAAFVAAASVLEALPEGTAVHPCFVDIDADADLDAFIGTDAGIVLFFRNSGSCSQAAFTASAPAFGLPAVTSAAQPTFADLDDDGDLDACIGDGQGRILMFRNTGTSTDPGFAGSSLAFDLGPGGRFADPSLVDIDADGDLDVIVGNRQGQVLAVRNSGAGGVSSATANGTYGAGSVITLELAFSEPVTVTGSPTLLLKTGATDRPAVYSTGSGTSLLSFIYTVQQGDSAADLDYVSAQSLQLNGGAIRNALGVPANRELPAPGSSGSLAANAALVIAMAQQLVGTSGADRLQGGAGHDRLDGLGGDDSLSGAAGDDRLFGGDGNDSLDGGSGNDSLDGGPGQDRFFVDSLADQISDSAGIDMVVTALNYSLADLPMIEMLWLRGQASSGIGNALNNRLLGNSSANLLDGGPGADLMQGAAGGDVYVVDNIGDLVIETSAALAGYDIIRASVSYILPANVELLILTGASSINGTGNGLRNRMYGNSGANVLRGEGGADDLRGANGDDILIGGDGRDSLDGQRGVDTLIGGGGGDCFRFDTAISAATNCDLISDFSAAEGDWIELSASIFSGLPLGALPDAAFARGREFSGPEQRILDSGSALFYDPDGNGPLAAACFATITAGTLLTAADLRLVS